MVRPEVLRRRLSKLEEYLRILERLSRYELQEFLSDPEHYGAAERFLQLAIEAINDMGTHVAVDLGLGSVEQARDLPELFFRRGDIDEALRRAWLRMIGFRNLLVHDYLEIDRKIVWRVLRERLGDLEALGRVFSRFL